MTTTSLPITWYNYGQTSWSVNKIIPINSVGQLTNLVRENSYAELPVHIRAFSDHSSMSSIVSGDIQPSSDVLLDMSLLKNIWINQDHTCVRVQSGVTFRELALALEAKQLEITNPPTAVDESIVGCFCSGGHGSGHLASIADQVIEVEFCNSKGIIVKSTPKEKMFKAVSGGFGALGIVTGMTLKVTSLRPILQLVYTCSIDQLQEEMNKSIRHEWFCSSNRDVIMWLPVVNDFFYISRTRQEDAKEFTVDPVNKALEHQISQQQPLQWKSFESLSKNMKKLWEQAPKSTTQLASNILLEQMLITYPENNEQEQVCQIAVPMDYMFEALEFLQIVFMAKQNGFTPEQLASLNTNATPTQQNPDIWRSYGVIGVNPDGLIVLDSSLQKNPKALPVIPVKIQFVPKTFNGFGLINGSQDMVSFDITWSGASADYVAFQETIEFVISVITVTWNGRLMLSRYQDVVNWKPEILAHLQSTYYDGQLNEWQETREEILRRDPKGIFQNRFTMEWFDLATELAPKRLRGKGRRQSVDETSE